MQDFSISDLTEPELEVVRVPVPEFNRDGKEICCHVKEMTANDRDKRCDTWWEHYKEQCEEDEVQPVGRVPWVAAACVCKEDGTWKAPSKLEVIELAEKFNGQKATAVERIVRAASELNGMGKSEVERIEKK